MSAWRPYGRRVYEVKLEGGAFDADDYVQVLQEYVFGGCAQAR